MPALPPVAHRDRGLCIRNLSGCRFVQLPGTQSDVTAKLSGWTAGAGVEYAFYKGMSLKLEYLYLGMGGFNSNITSNLIAGSPAIGGPSNINVHHSLSDNMIRLGLGGIKKHCAHCSPAGQIVR
jgi:opacity protein-like surface antigen